MSNSRFSIIQSRAVADKRISNSQFRTLSAMGTFGDRDGWMQVKLRTLGDILGKSPQAVSKDIQHLSTLGYVEITPQFREDGSRRNNQYRLLFDLNTPPQLNSVEGDQLNSVEGGSTPEVEALTMTVNVKNLNDIEGEKFEIQLQNMEKDHSIITEEKETKMMDKSGYANRIKEAIQRGASSNSGKADVEGYPPDVREVIQEVCGLWNLRPPHGSKKVGSPCAGWIEGARDLLDSCGEFGVEAIRSYRVGYESYMACHGGVAPHTVTSPHSLVNMVRAEAAKMREGSQKKPQVITYEPPAIQISWPGNLSG